MTQTTAPKLDTAHSTPNMVDYESTVDTFSWNDVQENLDGLPNRKGLNIAWEAIGRHIQAGRGDHEAFRFINKDNSRTIVNYLELDDKTNRFASVLARLGVRNGDVVFALTLRIEELYIAALGTLKNKSVFCPLFSAFGPEPIQTRLIKGGARVLVTTSQLYRRKNIEKLRNTVKSLEFVLLTDCDTGIEMKGVYEIPRLMEQASSRFEIQPTDPEDLALLHFTSGTTTEA